MFGIDIEHYAQFIHLPIVNSLVVHQDPIYRISNQTTKTDAEAFGMCVTFVT